MVSIYIDGQDRTHQICDWNVWCGNQHNELMLTVTFHSGKKYSLAMTRCEIIPTQVINGGLLTTRGKSVIRAPEKILIYGEKIAVAYYPNNNKPYITNAKEIKCVSETTLKDEAVFKYFVTVTQTRIEQAKEFDRPIAENVLRQLNKITSHPDNVLHAYCCGKSQTDIITPIQHFIYPFGVNESQLQAVERAFSSQMSIIEGPPGTGKTQTILNIVANILLNQKTVVILSNNNSAVENIYEKLAKENLDYLVAKLGSKDNRNQFFETKKDPVIEQVMYRGDIQTINNKLNQLKAHLHAKNQEALLKAQIAELLIEQQYLQEWRTENLITTPKALNKYKLSPQKITDLLAYLNYLAEKRISLMDRVCLLFNFRIIRTSYMSNLEQRRELIYALQHFYYEKTLNEKRQQLATYQQELEQHNFEHLLKELTKVSMLHLKNHLSRHIDLQATFNAGDYNQSFDKFMQRFPIIGSSTHSVINSLAKGALLDYVIIDEASQQDIIPGILGLGCAKNLIIVGDRKQLPHVPVEIKGQQPINPPKDYYDCIKYSLLDSFLGLFQGKIPITLLREHYRCHPKIIQFCNKQFYDNQLIPMTEDKGEQALSLINTAKGNHTRNFANQRELESICEVYTENNKTVGFITPYNNQVNLAKKYLSEEIIKATTHKFQGRECDEIIFSTVLDKKLGSQRQISFVDDPHLINVAVSRAKDKFTLTTGPEVFSKNNQSISALIRYIQYYADISEIYDSPVISAFDLLYDEYDKSLEKLNAKLSTKDSEFKSEQIVAQLLRELLTQEAYKFIKFHMQIKLEQLVIQHVDIFSLREKEFMEQGASCDFVLYYKVGKTPLGVIEVDGYQHNTVIQTGRDNLKNAILEKAEIPLLRLKTTDSNIENKIAEFLDQCIYSA